MQLAAGHAVLGQVAVEGLLDVLLRDAARVLHDGSSSGRTGPPPRMSASDGDQVTATSLPTGSSRPGLGCQDDQDETAGRADLVRDGGPQVGGLFDGSP